LDTVSSSRPSDSLQCDHGLRRQAIVQSLLTEVFQGRLRAGQHLVTQNLASRFGVSHTPIREALIALAGIGVIDLLPNRGAVVRRVSARDVREICQVRRVLECEATRRACGRAGGAELDALANALRGLIAGRPASAADLIAEARLLDNQLHDLIAASCGNAFLANELGRLKILFRAFRDVTYTHDPIRIASGRFIDEAREHLAIVQALAAGDRRSASRAMSRHILTSVEHWGRLLPDAADPERKPGRLANAPGRNGRDENPSSIPCIENQES
jgi:DNA-binding GntR family transcriptional regulator